MDWLMRCFWQLCLARLHTQATSGFLTGCLAMAMPVTGNYPVTEHLVRRLDGIYVNYKLTLS